MQKRVLGNTAMEITPIGFGAWAIGGGGYQFGWGDQEDTDSIGAIHRALDRGINWIDTAPVYGLGRSEEVVGRAIRSASSRPYIFTKCTLVWDDKSNVMHSLKAESIRREVEASLRRLRIDVIDLYQIHWPARPADGPALDLEEAWTEMARLKETGKVRHIGVSNFNVAQMKRAFSIAPISSLQPPYSIIHRKIEPEILPFCAEHQIGLIVYSPMQSGLLSGSMTRERIASLPDEDWRARLNPEFQEPRLSRNLELVELLRAIGARHGKSPGEVAIAWTLRQPAVTAAIVGARRADQIDGFIGAAEFRLSAEEIAEIEAFKLVK